MIAFVNDWAVLQNFHWVHVEWALQGSRGSPLPLWKVGCGTHGLMEEGLEPQGTIFRPVSSLPAVWDSVVRAQLCSGTSSFYCNNTVKLNTRCVFKCVETEGVSMKANEKLLERQVPCNKTTGLGWTRQLENLQRFLSDFSFCCTLRNQNQEQRVVLYGNGSSKRLVDWSGRISFLKNCNNFTELIGVTLANKSM